MTRRDDLRRKALANLQESEVLMLNGHFDYGNGYHGRAYLNPHGLFRHPSTIWRFAQDLLDLVPSARVGHIGLYRDPTTLMPVEYYVKLPEDVHRRLVVVVDPMLATGHSACAAVARLKQAGATQIRFTCLIAAPEGLQVFAERHSDVPVFTAAIDRELDEHGYIRPGLGDAGDRLFGTK